jgi:hypothetical protein
MAVFDADKARADLAEADKWRGRGISLWAIAVVRQYAGKDARTKVMNHGNSTDLAITSGAMRIAHDAANTLMRPDTKLRIRLEDRIIRPANNWFNMAVGSGKILDVSETIHGTSVAWLEEHRQDNMGTMAILGQIDRLKFEVQQIVENKDDSPEVLSADGVGLIKAARILRDYELAKLGLDLVKKASEDIPNPERVTICQRWVDKLGKFDYRTSVRNILAHGQAMLCLTFPLMFDKITKPFLTSQEEADW